MIRIMGIFFVFITTICDAKYYSQCGQDQFVNEVFFKNFKKGVFLDIGAHDGITFSNTYFFEKELEWSGICIEPIPEVFERLTKNRGCLCFCGCASPEHGGTKDFLCVNGYPEMLSGLLDRYDSRHRMRIEQEIKNYGGSQEVIKVQTYNINRVLEDAGIDHVNFLSIDTEGGEFEILQSIDFSKYRIDVITVEDNYQDKRFIPFLENNGFIFLKQLHQDLIFVNRNFNSNSG